MPRFAYGSGEFPPSAQSSLPNNKPNSTIIAVARRLVALSAAVALIGGSSKDGPRLSILVCARAGDCRGLHRPSDERRGRADPDSGTGVPTAPLEPSARSGERKPVRRNPGDPVASLEFRLESPNPSPPDSLLRVKGPRGEDLSLLREPVIRNADVSSVEVEEAGSSFRVILHLTPEAGVRMRAGHPPLSGVPDGGPPRRQGCPGSRHSIRCRTDRRHRRGIQPGGSLPGRASDRSVKSEAPGPEPEARARLSTP